MSDPADEAPRTPADMYLIAGCAGLFVGGLAGLVGGLVLPPIYYQLLKPATLRDGQWGMVYLLTLPAGAVVGALIGCGIACYFVAKERTER